MLSVSYLPYPQTQRLKQIASVGLKDIPSLEFMEISIPPFITPLTPEQAFRIGVFRLIIFRQCHQLSTVEQEINALHKKQLHMPNEDIFMFYCEAVRLYILLGKEDKALDYLLSAQIAKSKVSEEMQGYWLMVLFVMHVHLMDDKAQFFYINQTKQALTDDHPYAIAWNKLILRQNFNWSYALLGKMRKGLSKSYQILDELRQLWPHSATRKQVESEVLLMRAFLREKITYDELNQVWSMIDRNLYGHHSQIETSLSVAEALNARNNKNYDAAHLWFQKSLQLTKQHKSKGRITLYSLDQAAKFYKKHEMKDEYIQVLEQRHALLIVLRKRTSGILRQLTPLVTDLNQTRHELTISHREVVERLSAVGEWRDDATGQHTHRVAYLTRLLAQALGQAHAIDIAEAARLHDLGKVGVPDAILLKTGPLNQEERQAMQRHTIVGGQMLSNGNSKVLKIAQLIALYHHEHWDGQGYPDGLKGEKIPLEARIVAVVDVFDALISERPYKRAWSEVDALTEIRAQSGKQFDPVVVKAFEQVFKSNSLYTDQASDKQQSTTSLHPS